MNRLIPALSRQSTAVRNSSSTVILRSLQHHHQQHHLFSTSTPLRVSSLTPTPDESPSAEELERARRRQERSQRRQNVLFSLVGGVALVGTLITLLRSDLQKDRTEVVEQVDKVTQIRTSMELQRVRFNQFLINFIKLIFLLIFYFID